MTHPMIAQLMGDIPVLPLEEVAGHPKLPLARRIFIREFLKVYGADPHLARLLIETGRYMVFTFAIVAYAAQDPARPETWATVSRLKQVIQTFGPSSERQIDILLSRLRDLGFLELARSDYDGRVRIVRPTEQAMAHDRDWLVAHYAPLVALYPERDYSLVMSRDAAFQVRQRRRSMEFVPLVASTLMPPPEVMVFFGRPGGYMFLVALLEAAMESTDGTHATVSFADVGERFGYSRTHVRQVLVDAEAAGLVRLRGRGGHDVEILPALWSGHDRGIAIGMCLHDMVYARTAADWPRHAPKAEAARVVPPVKDTVM